MNFNRVLSGIMLLHLLVGSVEAKPRSIVGLWSAPAGGCTRADGPTIIKPLSLQNEDVTCKFWSVKRVGRDVVWKGICDDEEGASEQTVTASEQKGVLSLSYSPGGNVVKDMVRCGG
jgi:hypothetical protein